MPPVSGKRGEARERKKAHGARDFYGKRAPCRIATKPSVFLAREPKGNFQARLLACVPTGREKFPDRFPCAFPRFAQWLRARTLRTITEARPRPILTDFRLPENVAAGFNAGCRIKKNPHENELPMMKIADGRECQTFFGDFFAECLREISSARNIFRFLPP